MKQERAKAALDRFESSLILAANAVASAQKNITGALAVGYCESAVNGAVMDLRHAANSIEKAQKDFAPFSQA